MEPCKRFNKIADDKNLFNITEDQSAIDCLTYASVVIRHDSLSVEGDLSQHMPKPRKKTLCWC